MGDRCPRDDALRRRRRILRGPRRRPRPEAAKRSGPPRPAGASTLVVSGSASRTAHEFAVSAGKRGWKVCRMPELVFGGEGVVDRGIKQWIDATLAALKSDGRAIIAIDHAVDRTPGTGRRLERAIARVTAEVVKKHPIEQFLVDGGATASACTNAIGWGQFETLSELQPGVVRLKPIVAVSGVNCSMVVKPGSYKWPDGLV
ncbi:MAG: nucleotide-binding domain containing protein [Tepidisphaeraceae bacterium]